MTKKKYRIEFGMHNGALHRAGNVTFFSSHDHNAIKHCWTILQECNNPSSSFELYEGWRLVFVRKQLSAI